MSRPARSMGISHRRRRRSKQPPSRGSLNCARAVEQPARRGMATHGWKKFADFYMSVRRTCELGESCALQSLTPEVARADDETKAAYEAELLRVVDAVAEGLPDGTLPQRRKAAWAVLSILSGGVTLARAVDDPKIGACHWRRGARSSTCHLPREMRPQPARSSPRDATIYFAHRYPMT